MADEIIAAIVGSILTFIFWRIRKWYTKDEDVEKRNEGSTKNKSENDNVDSLSIKNLADAVDQLNDLYTKQLLENVNLRKLISVQSGRISNLEGDYESITREHAKLSREYEELLVKFNDLEAENSLLKKMLLKKELNEERSKKDENE